MPTTNLLEAPATRHERRPSSEGRAVESRAPAPAQEEGSAPPSARAWDPEILAALAALLEPLSRWIAATRGPLHRLEVASFYARVVPEDAALVRLLCTEGASLVVERLQHSGRSHIAGVVEAEASIITEHLR